MLICLEMLRTTVQSKLFLQVSSRQAISSLIYGTQLCSDKSQTVTCI